MTARSAGRATAAPRGGSTGGRTGRGGGRTIGRSGDQVNGRIDCQGDQIGGQGSEIRRMVATTEPTTIQKAVQIAGTLTDEAIRNGSPKKNPKREEMGENLVRIRMGGMITRELGLRMFLLQPKTLLGERTRDCRVVPRNMNPINARNPTARTCYEYGSTDHFKAACPRLNQAQRPNGNHQNQVVAVNGV
nr:hypothetical protein [Tanacetum cinerariifolium]